MISMLHQTGKVGHGRPEHSGTSGVKNRLIKGGVAFGGGGSLGAKTMKAESVEAPKKKKEKTVKKGKVRSFKPIKGKLPPHPLAGITPKPTEKEADELMSNLPITDKKLKSMGKKRKKIRSFKPKKKGLLQGQGYY